MPLNRIETTSQSRTGAGQFSGNNAICADCPASSNTSIARLPRMLTIIDLAEIGHLSLNHASALDAPVLDDRPSPMLLAILAANLVAQKHAANSRRAVNRARDLVGTTDNSERRPSANTTGCRDWDPRKSQKSSRVGKVGVGDDAGRRPRGVAAVSARHVFGDRRMAAPVRRARMTGDALSLVENLDRFVGDPTLPRRPRLPHRDRRPLIFGALPLDQGIGRCASSRTWSALRLSRNGRGAGTTTYKTFQNSKIMIA